MLRGMSPEQMSDVILLVFMIVVFSYTTYLLLKAKPVDRLSERARQRRINSVWKDRGTL